MANGYMTSSDLIAAVQRKAAIPVNQSTFTNDDILAFANSEMKIGLIPTVMSVHEEYYVTPKVLSLVSGQTSYSIPYRAIGGKLRDIKYVDTSGNLRDMSRVAEENIAQWGLMFSSYTEYSRYFYLQGNNVNLLPNNSTNPQGSLLMEFYMRPNDLVTVDQASTITAIAWDTVANTVTFTVNQIPKGFSPLTPFDLLQTLPGHKTYNYDLIATSVNTANNTMTFTATDVTVPFFGNNSPVIVGDYIALAGQCIIPQCPSDLHDVLAQRVAARCLEALGDAQGLNNANVKLQEMESKALPLIDNRVEGTPQKITNKRSLIRSSKLNRFRWS